MEPTYKVLFAASECAPFAREGALGDRVGALPAALRALGHDVRVVIPRYGWISPVATDGMARHLAPLAVPVGDGEAWCAVYEARAPGSDVPVYMIDHEVLFDRPYLYDPPGGTSPDNLARFTVLSRGALQLCKHLGWIPNVIHAHDWPTALVSVYLATGERRGMFRRVASVLSLHEVMYQGRFHGHERAVAQVDDEAFQADGAEEYGELNVLKGGGLFADMLVATSPERAAALCTPDGGYGLDAVFARRASDLTGITSGTDAASWEEAARQHVEVYRRAIEKRRATG